MWWIIAVGIWLFGALCVWLLFYASDKANEAAEKTARKLREIQGDGIDIVQTPKEPDVKACDFDE